MCGGGEQGWRAIVGGVGYPVTHRSSRGGGGGGGGGVTKDSDHGYIVRWRGCRSVVNFIASADFVWQRSYGCV